MSKLIKPKVVAIIQARMSSSRLPGKVLAEIEGKTLLTHVINRVKSSKSVDEIVVATTKLDEDLPICRVALISGTNIYQGSDEDVLDRFYTAAKQFSADIIVRITSDDPFKDPGIIDKIVYHLLNNTQLDYVSNTIEPTYPEGLDVEAFRFGALERAWRQARLHSEREHVTPYIWKNPDKFKLDNLKNYKNLSHLRWTVDYNEDLYFAREIYRRLSDKGIFQMGDVLEILEAEPELIKINSCIERNLGYKLSSDRDII